MDSETIQQHSYREDYTNIRTWLYVILMFEFVFFTLIYFIQYNNNNYHFFQSYQQEKQRLFADSIFYSRELEIESKLYNELLNLKDTLSLENRYLGKVFNFLADPKVKLNDTISLEDTDTFIRVANIDGTTKEGEEIFTIYFVCDSLIEKSKKVNLKLEYNSFSKYANKSSSNENDNIIIKIEAQKAMAWKDLNAIYSKLSIAEKNLNKVHGILKNLKQNSDLDLIDFLIFTGNIHTSLSFNGIMPASQSMRFICLMHKILVILLYYLLLTKYKKKY